MKKILLISFVTLFTAILTAAIIIIYVSFSIVLPTTQQINQNLAKFMTRIVYIPEGIPPPIFGYETTSYFWEMETPAGEVTGIRFSYTPAFAKGENKITAVLEMPELGDASIFTKVLPAVISDNRSLTAAQDPLKANLAASREVGYEGIKLTLKPETGQTTKVVWQFAKITLDQETLGLYSRLGIYPEPLLKILHELPRFIIGLLGG
ncbi:MAG: hypothetical protein AAB639_00600 [Patescibacteria group bacterium]